MLCCISHGPVVPLVTVPAVQGVVWRTVGMGCRMPSLVHPLCHRHSHFQTPLFDRLHVEQLSPPAVVCLLGVSWDKN